MLRDRLEYAGFLFLRRLILTLPLKSAQRLGALLGIFTYSAWGSRRRIALENLRQAFPEASLRERTLIARGAFRNAGISLIEFLWVPNLNDDRLRSLLRVENPELLLEARRRGKGVILLAGHFGNWELVALGVARLLNLSFKVIVRTQRNRYVDRVINSHRCFLGNTIAPAGIAVREIITTLREGGIVAMAPDQSGPKEAPRVEFFGRQTPTHQGPSVFALHSRAPMIIGSMTRGVDGAYTVVLQEIEYSDLTESSEDSVRRLTQRHVTLLEEIIRRVPEQWLWMHRRWKHAPEFRDIPPSAPTVHA